MLSLSNIMSDPDRLKSLYRLADYMSQSKLMVPSHLIGNQNDCFAVCMLALKLDIDPWSLANQTYSIKGKISYTGQLINALAMNSSAIEGSFKYEFRDWVNGNGWIRCGARLKGEDEVTFGEWLDTNTVSIKNSPLWKTNPKQQSAYLVVRNFVRLYAPSVLMGMYTEDELRTIEPDTQERDVTPIAELLEAKEADPTPLGSLVEEQPEEVPIEVCEEAQEFFEEK